MSGPIKLHYFDLAALGEPIKFLLHYGGMKFTDIRIPTVDAFVKIKPTFPYGKVPVLEIEGKTIHQTKAICRYLAKKVGLAGKSEWDALECDIIVDTIEDLRGPMAAYYYEQNEVAKEEKKEPLFSTLIPFYLNKFEEQLNKNGGYFVNSQLTWADFYFAALADYLSEYLAGKDLFADKPALKALRAKVMNLKGIKEYIATRPPLVLLYN